MPLYPLTGRAKLSETRESRTAGGAIMLDEMSFNAGAESGKSIGVLEEYLCCPGI